MDEANVSLSDNVYQTLNGQLFMNSAAPWARAVEAKKDPRRASGSEECIARKWLSMN